MSDLWGISFHAAVVFILCKDFLSKYALGHCAEAYENDNLITIFEKSNIIYENPGGS